MIRKSILHILIDLVFLAVFNVLFFVIGGTERVLSVWISYGFIHFAYIMLLVTYFLIRKGSSSSALFGMTLYGVSGTYFIVEFLTGLIFILIAGNSFVATLVVQVILAGIYLVILLTHVLANEHTAASVAKHEAEVAYIKNTAIELKALVGKASDKKANKEIEKAYDIVHSSPTKSSVAVQQIEKRIDCLVFELRDVIKYDDAAQIIDIAREIVELTEERNRNLRLPN